MTGGGEDAFSPRRKGLLPNVGSRLKVEDEGRESPEDEAFRCRPKDQWIC